MDITDKSVSHHVMTTCKISSFFFTVLGSEKKDRSSFSFLLNVLRCKQTKIHLSIVLGLSIEFIQ